MSQGRPGWVYGPCGDSRFTDLISLADVSLSVRDFYDNINMSWWALVTNGYLDPNAYKKGKGKATSQIELRSQNRQMEQRSYANSTLNITNGEAVSHHYSYDRQAAKEMGSTTRTAKTQKILGQAMVKPGRT